MGRRLKEREEDVVCLLLIRLGAVFAVALRWLRAFCGVGGGLGPLRVCAVFSEVFTSDLPIASSSCEIERSKMAASASGSSMIESFQATRSAVERA